MSSPSNTGQSINDLVDLVDLVGKMYITHSYAVLPGQGAVEHVEENTRLLLLDIDVETDDEWCDGTGAGLARTSLYFKLMLPAGNIAWWIYQTTPDTKLVIKQAALVKFLEWASPVPA